MRLGCVIMAAGSGTRFAAACPSAANKLLMPLAGEPVIARTVASVARCMAAGLSRRDGGAPAGPHDRAAAGSAAGAVPIAVGGCAGARCGAGRQELFELVIVTRDAELAAWCDAHGMRCAVPRGPHRSDSVRAGLAMRAAWDGALFLPGDQPLVRGESFQRLAAAFRADPSVPWRLAWGGHPASPVLFPRRLFPVLKALSGADGGRSVLAGEARIGMVEACEAEELLDIDTPTDLARAVEALEARMRRGL